MAEEYTNPSPRQELSYVSTKDNLATSLNAVSAAFNAAGDYMVNKGIKLQQEQEKADAQFINNMALQMQADFEADFAKDGNYEQYDQRKKEFDESFVENLKKNTGKDKAVDRWYKTYGENFGKYSQYSYERARDDSYEALNKASVDREMNLTANTPGNSFNDLQKSGESVYSADLDISKTNNPSSPTTRMDKGGTLFSTSMKDFIEKAVDGTSLDSSGKRFSADSALEYFFNGGDESNPILSYTSSSGATSTGFDSLMSYIGDGFTPDYMANPSNVDKDSLMKAVEGQRGKYEQAFRDSWRAAEEEKLKQLDDQCGDWFRQVSLNTLLTGETVSMEDVRKFADSEGIDLKNDPIAIEYFAAKVPAVKEDYQAADRERSQWLKNSLDGEADNITNLVGSGGNYYTPEKVSVYSTEGVETIDNDTSLSDNVYAFLEESFLKNTGEGEVGIATQYGGAVEWFCDRYKITDPMEKMQVASKINKMFSSSASGGSGSSGGSTAGGNHSAGWAIYEAMYNDVNNFSQENIQEALNDMVFKNEISSQEYQQASTDLKNRNSPIDQRYSSAKSIFSETLGTYGLNNETFKGLIGFSSSADDKLKAYIQNNPQATDDQIRRYCEDVISPYISENIVDEVSSVVNDAISELTGNEYVDIDDTNKYVDTIWNSYMSGTLWFVNNNPEGVGDLKKAINGKQFTSKNELWDYAAKTFFGGSYGDLKFKDLTDYQQNQVSQAMVVAYKEAEQYNMVKDAAMAVKPASMDGSDYLREVRFGDGSIGIMTRNGFVFRANYSEGGSGSKTDMMIGYVGMASDDYNKVFGKGYAEYAGYHKGTSQMIGMPSNITRYNPVFFSTNKSETKIQDRSSTMTKEEQERFQQERLNLLKIGKDEEISKIQDSTMRIKQDWAVSEDDFRRDDKLNAILGTLYRGYVSSSWNQGR